MTANSTPESFDAVVAEMRDFSKSATIMHVMESPTFVAKWTERLQSAHARELAEQQATHAAEVGKYKVAWEEFSERTEWVQQTAKPKEIGLHRADVLRLRIEQAEARADAAMGLLREVVAAGNTTERIDAFLAQQALAGGERKDG